MGVDLDDAQLDGMRDELDEMGQEAARQAEQDIDPDDLYERKRDMPEVGERAEIDGLFGMFGS